MSASDLLEAIETQDETLSMGLGFEERIRLIVDEAYSSFTHSKVSGLDCNTLTALGSCAFVDRQQNVVLQGFTGSGKSYLGCALAKQACRHRIRAHYVRMPDLEEAWAQAQDKPLGAVNS